MIPILEYIKKTKPSDYHGITQIPHNVKDVQDIIDFVNKNNIKRNDSWDNTADLAGECSYKGYPMYNHTIKEFFTIVFPTKPLGTAFTFDIDRRGNIIGLLRLDFDDTVMNGSIRKYTSHNPINNVIFNKMIDELNELMEQYA